MAPSKANNGPLFVKDEQCMCFHGEYLYEAKILDVRTTDDPNVWQYKIHYKGWKATLVILFYSMCLYKKRSRDLALRFRSWRCGFERGP